jgi:hypothetical protein
MSRGTVTEVFPFSLPHLPHTGLVSSDISHKGDSTRCCAGAVAVPLPQGQDWARGRVGEEEGAMNVELVPADVLVRASALISGGECRASQTGG